MRRDRVATRILLILSAVHVAAAAPAIIRQRSVEVTKDVTAALEKRAKSDDESSHPLPRMDNILTPTSGTLPSQDDTSPAPGDPELHSDPPAELGTPQFHDDLPPMPGAPPSQYDTSSALEDPQLHDDDSPPWWPHTDWRPPEEMLHGGSSGTAEIPPPHDDLSWQHANWHPLEETLQGEPSVVPQWHEDPWWQDLDWASPVSPGSPATPGETLYEGSPGRSPTTSGTPQLQNDSPSESGTSQSHDEELGYLNRWGNDFGVMDGASSWSDSDSEASMPVDSPPALGAPQVHDDPHPASGTPQLHDHGSEELGYLNRWGNDFGAMDGASSSSVPDAPMPVDSPSALGTPQGHDDPPPASGSSQLHDDGLKEFDSSYRWHNDFRVKEGVPSSSDFDSDAPPLDLETPPLLDSETPPLHSETPLPLHSETPPSLDSETPPSLDSETPPPLESEALSSAPETHTFFNDALKQKLKVYAGVGAVAGFFVGSALGVDKLIRHHSHGSYVSAFFHPSLINI
jgi:hypothetical protein